MTRQQILRTLGDVQFEPGCVCEDDPGEVVSHARPLDDRARAAIREQQIAQMRRDPVAIAARERRIAVSAGAVLEFSRARSA